MNITVEWQRRVTTVVMLASAVLGAFAARGEEPANPRVDRPMLAALPVAELKAPPMSEGIAATPGGLAVVFENAAKIYIGNERTPYVDHIRILPLK